MSSPVITDQNAINALAAVRAYDLRQGNVTAEIVAGSCLPNTYILGDSNIRKAVPGYKNPSPCVKVGCGKEEDVIAQPVFIIQEESSMCCRCCCPGLQPLFAKVYNADPSIKVGRTRFCCIYMGHTFAKQEGPPVFTMERDGCKCLSCKKWLGCFVCNMCCQEDSYIFAGDPTNGGGPPTGMCGGACSTKWTGPTPGEIGPVSGGHVARILQPCGGGGCHPVLNILSSKDGQDTPVAVLEGPMFMKGCIELCCDTTFFFSTQEGKSGDLGKIIRPKPADCYNCCRMLCTQVDFYTVEYTDAYMKQPNEMKAAMLAAMIQLDYMFFEDDRPPVDCEVSDDGKDGKIICTLCFAYCYGCQIPCKIAIPLKNPQSGGG